MIKAIDKLKKSEVLLNNWKEEYIFHKKPNPNLIFNKDNSTEKVQMLKWNGKHDVINTLTRIGQDYVSDSRAVLIEAEI